METGGNTGDTSTTRHCFLDCATQTGLVLEIESGDTIGREGDVDVSGLLDSEYMSRKHARFKYKGGRWVIGNLSTKSFTYVNGAQVAAGTEVEVKDGDRVTMGTARFTFRES